ncbi:MAG: hypothetical protein AAGA48_18235, partial [Myxococcota bacterium]
MSEIVIKRGLNIPISGAASGDVVDLPRPATVAYSPTEFNGLVAKPAIREGDAVERGTVLFFHKHDARIVFRSPSAGRVSEIRRGARRVITDFIVETAELDATAEMPKFTLEQLEKLDADAALEAAMGTGLFGAFKTRPLNKMPTGEEAPQSIFIGGWETGPLQPDVDVLLSEDDQAALQAAITVFGRFAPKVHLGIRRGAKNPAFVGLKGVDIHEFTGPHPAGDPGVQVNHVDPPRGSMRVWTIRAWDAVLLGRALLTGEFEATRIYAAVGAGVAKPRFVRTLAGAPMADIVGETNGGEHRWIRGSVLTGVAVDSARWASFLARAIHVLPDEVPRRLFGWALPEFFTWSVHRAFLSGFLPNLGTEGSDHTVDLRPGIWGGVRAMVPVDAYRRVIATPDIMPEFLFKSMASGDIEESIQLGLLDLTDEEAALCTYICPS